MEKQEYSHVAQSQSVELFVYYIGYVLSFSRGSTLLIITGFFFQIMSAILLKVPKKKEVSKDPSGQLEFKRLKKPPTTSRKSPEMEIKPEFGGVQLKKATTTITAQEEPQNVNKIQDLAKVDKID